MIPSRVPTVSSHLLIILRPSSQHTPRRSPSILPAFRTPPSRPLPQARFYNYAPRDHHPRAPRPPTSTPTSTSRSRLLPLPLPTPPSPGTHLHKVARSPLTHSFVLACILAATAFYFYNVQTVPITGRRRFNCFGDGNSSLSKEMVNKVIRDIEREGGRILPDGDARTQLVMRVMRRLIPVSGLEGVDWEVRVVESGNGSCNAFVLPGGKVFVFDGIIHLARTESGLAAVLGHEIAHNLAQHHGERLSAALGTNILLYSLLFLTAPLGSFLVFGFLGDRFLDILFGRPMSRVQEREADYIGLMLMAEACYDPRQALIFWKRAEALAREQGTDEPEWWSTHPSHQNRITKIRDWMPRALEKQAQSDCSGQAAFAEIFKRAMNKGSLVET